MSKKAFFVTILSLIVLIFSPFQVYADHNPNAPESKLLAWQNIMTETFEGAFPSGSWQTFDNDGTTNGEYYWDDESYKPHLGSWSGWVAGAGANALNPSTANYADNMNSWMIYGPFDLSNATSATLDFYYWNQSEEGCDYFKWMASANGSNFYGYQVSGDSGGWISKSFDLTSVPTIGNLTGDSSVWIAFVFISDGSVTQKGAFVDDIVLKKDVQTATPPVPDLVSVSGIPSTIEKNQSFTVTVTARNTGGTSNEGAINSSILFSDGTDNLTVDNVSASWADLPIINYAPGQGPVSDKNCVQIPGGAVDHLVEAVDSNWTNGTSYSMSFRVTPQKAGTLWVRVRTTMHGSSGCNYYNDTSVSGGVSDTDQQGWGVVRFAVTVTDPPQPTRLEPNTFVDTSTQIGVPVLLKAKLEKDNWPFYDDIQGQMLHFDIYYSGSWHEIADDGISSTSLITNSDGIASVYYTPQKGFTPNTYQIRARFDGSTTYAASSLLRNLTIIKPNWVLLYYMANGSGGGSSLETGIESKFRAIAQEASNQNYVAYLLWDHVTGEDRIFKVTQNSDWVNGYTRNVDYWTATDIGLGSSEIDTGDLNSLNKFVDFVTGRTEGSRYGLVIFNHGAGVYPNSIYRPTDIITGIGWDDSSFSNYLSVVELGQGLSHFETAIGKNLDFLHLDACLMQMIEVGYEVRNNVDYVIGSENEGWTRTSGTSWETNYLKGITSSTSGETLAISIANSYHSYASSMGDTVSVLRASYLNDVASAVSNLASVLISNMPGIRSGIVSARNDTQKFAWPDTANTMTLSNWFIDLRDLALEIASHVSNTDVVNAANALATAIGNEGGTFIRWEAHSNPDCSLYCQQPGYTFDAGTYGVAIFFPRDKFTTLNDINFLENYLNLSTSPSNLAFTASTQWDEFLRLYTDDIKPTTTLTQPSTTGWQKGDVIVSATASDSASEIINVRFEYSLDQTNWYPLPGPDSPDGYDWYGANGWSLTFRTTSTPTHGTINDASVWVRAAATDRAGNVSLWSTSVSFGVDNSAPTFTTSDQSSPVVISSFTMLQGITDSLSGVKDDATYPKFYWRYNNSTIDASQNDGSGNGTLAGSYYAVNISIAESREGQTIYWRVLARDNADNESWSAVHTGGVVSDDDTAGPTFTEMWDTDDTLPGTFYFKVRLSDPSGILDDTNYPRVYYRWNNNVIDDSQNDGYVNADWDGSWYTAALAVDSSRTGQTVYWRAYAGDNDNSPAYTWSPVQTGGKIIGCFTLTTNVNPSGTGSVNVTTAQNCSGGYRSDTQVTLTPQANTGYTFNNWSGNASGNLVPLVIVMDGNKSITANFLDIINPTGSISINSGAEYTKTVSVTLTLSASDSGSGVSQMRFSNSGSPWTSWEAYSSSKAWTLSTGDGIKTVNVEYRDGVGNTSNTYSDTITLDTTAPTGTVTINSGAAHTTSTSVTLGITASDSGSGMDQMRFSNNGTEWTSWEGYATTKPWTLSTGDGTKTVYVQFTDRAGNQTQSYTDTIILDTTSPTGTITINSGADHTATVAVTLTLNASDSGLGVSQMCISNESATCSSWEAYVSSKNWTLMSGDGIKRVYVQYRDSLNNTSTPYSDTINLDTSAPTGSISINSGAEYTKTVSVTLTLSASDSGSGVSQMRFSNSGSPWTSWESFSTTKNLNLSTGDGEKTVSVQFQDSAGNISLNYNDTIKLDTTGPETTILAPRISHLNSFTVSWSGVDITSGVHHFDIQYKLGDGGIWTDWVLGTQLTAGIFGPTFPGSSIPVERGQKILFRGKGYDNAGNAGEYSDEVWTLLPNYQLFAPYVIKN